MNFSIFIVFLTTLLITITAIYSVFVYKNLRSTIALIISFIYNTGVILYGLRVNGVLETVDSELGRKALNDVFNSIPGDSGGIVIQTILWFAFFAVNLLTAYSILFIGKKGFLLRWVMSFFIATLGILVGTSVAISLLGTHGTIKVLFDLCCGIMTSIAFAFGLTYEEMCMLVNVYLQAVVLLGSALLLLFMGLSKLKEDVRPLRIVAIIAIILYVTIHICAFIMLIFHYWMPLESAFLLCRDELNRFGFVLHCGDRNMSYMVANFLVFVIGWLSVLVLNVSLYRIGKKNM